MNVFVSVGCVNSRVFYVHAFLPFECCWMLLMFNCVNYNYIVSVICWACQNIFLKSFWAIINTLTLTLTLESDWEPRRRSASPGRRCEEPTRSWYDQQMAVHKSALRVTASEKDRKSVLGVSPRPCFNRATLRKSELSLTSLSPWGTAHRWHN